MEKIGLAEAIDALQAELASAVKEAQGQEIQFPIGSIQLEFQVGVTRDAEARAGVRFWVLESEGSAGYTNESVQKVILNLEAPVNTEGQTVKVARGPTTLTRPNLNATTRKTEMPLNLSIRIEEEPLTASHLSETLDTFISLYTKMWLLQQGRFDDFLRYDQDKGRHFEAEAHLLISELKYNSPIDVKFNIDLSLKSLVEALQMLVDMIEQRKQRKQAEELKLLKEQISVLDQSVETAKHIVETFAPGLDADQKGRAIQSILTDLRKLAQDPTFEMSLTLSASSSQPQSGQITEAKQPIVQQSEQTAP